MSHVVEVRHIGLDHDAALGELQRWLDQEGIRPTLFEHSAGGPGITFRVHFAMEEEAAAFAATFHGWLNDGTEPETGVRWDPRNVAASCADTAAAASTDGPKFHHRRAAHAADVSPGAPTLPPPDPDAGCARRRGHSRSPPDGDGEQRRP